MALETKALLKSIYRAIMISNDLEECREAVRSIMEPEDVAYVEKMIDDRKQKQKQNP